ncbi:MAG: hypothetical protein LRZ87_02050 [Methanocellales archaeon]|nr:hypothetical protein [Methanocellales archaeon]
MLKSDLNEFERLENIENALLKRSEIIERLERVERLERLEARLSEKIENFNLERTDVKSVGKD